MALVAVFAALIAALEVAAVLFACLTRAFDPTMASPWRLIGGWMTYSHVPGLQRGFNVALELAAGVLVVLPGAVVFSPELVATLGRTVLRRRGKLHGEAHWATRGEIGRAGLMGRAGIVVGKWRGKYLLFNGDGRGKNVLIAAPPGSGKTAGIMLPNCLAWTQTLVALDIKGECHARTAGYRERCGQRVYRLDFSSRDGTTHQYNPFAYVSDNPDIRVGDVEKIARYLCPDPVRGDPFWATSGREMLRALALYLFDVDQPVTLGAIRDLLDTEDGLRHFAKDVLRDIRAEVVKGISARVTRDLATIANRSENTHSGVVDQLLTALAPFANPLVRFATSANSFDLRELRKHPTSVYLVVARPDLPSLRPILNLFVQQLVDLNTLVEFGRDPEHRCEILLAMDEFAQVGRLDAIFEGITYFRSFGLRLLAIVQSPAQLKEIYSIDAAQSFEQSFDCRVYFTPAASDLDTAETVSRLLGTDTVSGTSRSVRLGFSRRASSETQTDKPRPLLLPQEVLRMDLGKEIILVSGLAPILADKIRVWKEPEFTGRVGRIPDAG